MDTIPEELRDRCHGQHPGLTTGPYNGQHRWQRTTFRVDKYVCVNCGATKILFHGPPGTALRPAYPTLAEGYVVNTTWPDLPPAYYRKVDRPDQIQWKGPRTRTIWK